MSIKTLSPYYLYVPLINPLTGVICLSYTIQLYIWDGSRTAVPVAPEYIITKINAAASNGDDKINLSRIANDYIEYIFEKPTDPMPLLQNANNQVWLQYQIYYNDLPDIPSLQGVELAVKGYGFFLEGENPQLPTNRILIEGDEFKVNRDGYAVIPLMSASPSIAPRTLTLSNVVLDTGTTYTFDYDPNFTMTSMYMLVRSVGDTEFTAVAATIDTGTETGETTIPSGISSGDFEIKGLAFDVVTSATIQSNLVTVT